MDLLKPKEITVTDLDGIERRFIISRLPSTVGREIVTTYPINMVPKIGEYKANEAMMFKMMEYVEAIGGDGKTPIRLTTRALVDNHTGDWEALGKLEIAMMEYNTSFFGRAKLSSFLEDTGANLKRWAIQMLTELLDASSKAAKPRSTN